MAARGRFLGFGGGERAVLLLVNPPLAPPRRGTRHVDGWWVGVVCKNGAGKYIFCLGLVWWWGNSIFGNYNNIKPLQIG